MRAPSPWGIQATPRFGVHEYRQLHVGFGHLNTDSLVVRLEPNGKSVYVCYTEDGYREKAATISFDAFLACMKTLVDTVR